MNYDEALNYIHNTNKFGWKLGLQNMAALLDLMGNPQDKLKFVHVAGTNGKGSTVTFISSILMEAGYRVGVYTSPYIERFTERMRVGSEEIGRDHLARLTTLVKEKIDIMVSRGENHPTEFEIVTAIAFQYFYESNCPIVVLEVGLGGRFDATNIISTPEAAVITTISYDHMSHLGNTLTEIAFEKAGIIKEGGSVLLYPQDLEVEKVFESVAAQRKGHLIKVDACSAKIRDFGAHGQIFDYGGYEKLEIALLGDHQAKNAAMAVRTAEVLNGKGFDIDENAIRKGLKSARWPGRLEIVNKEPLVMIDGAHNAEGAQMLAEALGKYFPKRRKIFIIGVLKDKDYKALIEAISPMAHQCITVTPPNDRALSAEELAIFIKSYCKNVLASDTIEWAVRTSMEGAGEGDLICAFGSLYYIGEIRKMFLKA